MSGKRQFITRDNDRKKSLEYFKSFFRSNFKREMTKTEEFIFKQSFVSGWKKGKVYKE